MLESRLYQYFSTLRPAAEQTMGPGLFRLVLLMVPRPACGSGATLFRVRRIKSERGRPYPEMMR